MKAVFVVVFLPVGGRRLSSDDVTVWTSKYDAKSFLEDWAYGENVDIVFLRPARQPASVVAVREVGRSEVARIFKKKVRH